MDSADTVVAANTSVPALSGADCGLRATPGCGNLPAGRAARHVALPPVHRSVPLARAHAHTILAEWGLDSLRASGDVGIVVSELVTNAVRHARHGELGIDLVLVRSPDVLRVEVHDPDPRLPRKRRSTATSGSGWGLVLVEDLSVTWGTQTTGGTGKCVWAEFHTNSPQQPNPAPER